jgi:hypothetical protein
MIRNTFMNVRKDPKKIKFDATKETKKNIIGVINVNV